MGSRVAGDTMKKFKKDWLSDAAVYPIIAIICSASGILATYGTRVFYSHPDVTFTNQGVGKYTDEQQQRELGEQHFNHTVRQYVSSQTTEVFPSLNKWLLKKRLEQMERERREE